NTDDPTGALPLRVGRGSRSPGGNLSGETSDVIVFVRTSAPDSGGKNGHVPVFGLSSFESLIQGVSTRLPDFGPSENNRPDTSFAELGWFGKSFPLELSFPICESTGLELSLRSPRLFSGVSVCCSSCRRRRLINSTISPPETFKGSPA